jgi:hypothetical protein
VGIALKPNNLFSSLTFVIGAVVVLVQSPAQSASTFVGTNARDVCAMAARYSHGDIMMNIYDTFDLYGKGQYSNSSLTALSSFELPKVLQIFSDLEKDIFAPKRHILFQLFEQVKTILILEVVKHPSIALDHKKRMIEKIGRVQLLSPLELLLSDGSNQSHQLGKAFERVAQHQKFCGPDGLRLVTYFDPEGAEVVVCNGFYWFTLQKFPDRQVPFLSLLFFLAHEVSHSIDYGAYQIGYFGLDPEFEGLRYEFLYEASADYWAAKVLGQVIRSMESDNQIRFLAENLWYLCDRIEIIDEEGRASYPSGMSRISNLIRWM